MQIGIDEVGRGSLAGPLVIGAVGLSKPIKGLKDSKQLSIAQREALSKDIYHHAKAASLGWVWPHEIDTLGLTAAMTLGIKRALASINDHIDSIIIDGNYNFLPEADKVSCLIHADQLIPSVSAASIIAKVARDNYMRHISSFFPDYDFASHVGYGTSIHLQKIADFGPCVLHRLSFRPLSEKIFD